jgi:predicted  nucleic acid-binding Zn-ribbon protein
LAHLEAELSQARRSLEQKDVELGRLHSQVEQVTREADEAQREAEQRSQALEERLASETESSMLRAEVEKFRALEELRGEHQRAMERERKVMEDWMQDVKERFRVEQQRFEERISALEAVRSLPRAPSTSGSSTHAPRSASRSDDPYPTPGQFHELEISEL